MNKDQAKQELTLVKAREAELLSIINKTEPNIDSLKKAYEYIGVNIEDEIPFKEPKNADQVNTNAFVKLKLFIRAINKKSNNGVELEIGFRNKAIMYCQWWNTNTSGFGFSYYDFTDSDSLTHFAFRLSFLDKKEMIRVSKIEEIITLYKQLIQE